MSRINRRSRPRPYDLRRKVLLKNFLREQMTHIPLPETRIESSSQNNIVTFEEESSVSIHLDEDLPELNEDLMSLPTDRVNTQSSPSLCDNTDPYPIVIDSKDDISVNIDKSVDANSACASTSDSSMFKFASLVKLKKESKKTLKGIFKAKDVCKSVKSPMKTRSFKSGLERVFYGRKRPSESTSSNHMSRNSPRSLFSLFKHRREQRNLKEATKFNKSTCINHKTSNNPFKSSTTSQSAQTDDSWAKEEMVRVQESNRRLKEENRLLSESLSYFMTNASMDSQIKRNSPLQSSNKNINSTIFPDYYVPSSNSSRDSWNLRSRVTRSKSVQEYNERRNMSRNNYRTRSMSYHNYRNNSLSTDVKPFVSEREHGTQSQVISIPRVRRKTLLNLPVSSTIRGIQRRSSMPERILSENDRSVMCRRSGSFRDTYTRKPFNSLPSEAFY